MSERKAPVWAEGMIVRHPHEKAPEYVKAKISVEVEPFTAWLREHETAGGWVTLEIKESKAGKLYAQLDTFVPNTEAATQRRDAEVSGDNDNLPF